MSKILINIVIWVFLSADCLQNADVRGIICQHLVGYMYDIGKWLTTILKVLYNHSNPSTLKYRSILPWQIKMISKYVNLSIIHFTEIKPVQAQSTSDDYPCKVIIIKCWSAPWQPIILSMAEGRLFFYFFMSQKIIK